MNLLESDVSNRVGFQLASLVVNAISGALLFPLRALALRLRSRFVTATLHSFFNCLDHEVFQRHAA